MNLWAKIKKIKFVIFSIFVITISYSFCDAQWREPTEAPPGGNVYAPLNVGADNQFKQGWLRIGDATDPAFPLDVNGDTRIRSRLAVGREDPRAQTGLTVSHDFNGIYSRANDLAIQGSAVNLAVEGRTDYGVVGQLGRQEIAVYGQRPDGIVGLLASPEYGAYARHQSGNYGYMGGLSFGALGENANRNRGTLGSINSGVRGDNGTSRFNGTLGNVDSGVHGETTSGIPYGELGRDDSGAFGEGITGHSGLLGSERAGVRGVASNGTFGELGQVTNGVYGALGDDVSLGNGVYGAVTTGVGVRGLNRLEGQGVLGLGLNEGVRGELLQSDQQVYGIIGYQTGTNYYGVYTQSLREDGYNTGINAEARDLGVRGYAPFDRGIGVSGGGHSVGVEGYNTSLTTGSLIGRLGYIDIAGVDYAVRGDGSRYGLYGVSSPLLGTGVYGSGNTGAQAAGVKYGLRASGTTAVIGTGTYGLYGIGSSTGAIGTAKTANGTAYGYLGSIGSGASADYISITNKTPEGQLAYFDNFNNRAIGARGVAEDYGVWGEGEVGVYGQGDTAIYANGNIYGTGDLNLEGNLIVEGEITFQDITAQDATLNNLTVADDLNVDNNLVYDHVFGTLKINGRQPITSSVDADFGVTSQQGSWIPNITVPVECRTTINFANPWFASDPQIFLTEDQNRTSAPGVGDHFVTIDNVTAQKFDIVVNDPDGEVRLAPDGCGTANGKRINWIAIGARQ